MKHVRCISVLALGLFIESALLFITFLPSPICHLFGAIYLVSWFFVWYLLLFLAFNDED